jgi:hypothetical protein
MTCPNDDTECDIKKQIAAKLDDDLKNTPKTIKYFMGFRSKNWKLQYEDQKDI